MPQPTPEQIEALQKQMGGGSLPPLPPGLSGPAKGGPALPGLGGPKIPGLPGLPGLGLPFGKKK